MTMSHEQLTRSLAIEGSALHHLPTKPLPTGQDALAARAAPVPDHYAVPLSSFSNHTTL
jgi:hypothetical protein